jgi:hypothetical protein
VTWHLVGYFWCRVLFQNKFEKLVNLVGFIIRIYHDARSSECQILSLIYTGLHIKYLFFLLGFIQNWIYSKGFRKNSYKYQTAYKNGLWGRVVPCGQTHRRTYGRTDTTKLIVAFCILIKRANEMHYFSNLCHKVLYMFRTGLLSIIRSISTLYTHNRYLSC